MSLFTQRTHLFAVFYIVIALTTSMAVTSGLTWPPEGDFYRDMGAAQSVVDGTPHLDAAYKGELRWYNPFLPSFIGHLSKFTSISIPILYSQSGPILNLLAPIAFYWLASLLIGVRAALVALACYLFFGNHTEASWYHPTYSPWLWPLNFAQGVSFFTMAVMYKALVSRAAMMQVIVGVLLGITFLTHTAPAIVIALILFGWVIWELCAKVKFSRAIKPLFLIGVPALIIAKDFIKPLYEKYGLKIQNAEPTSFSIVWGEYIFHSFMYPILFIGAGSVVLFITKKLVEIHTAQRRFLILFFISAALFLFYGLLASSLAHRGIASLPQIVPSFHFSLYTQAALYLFFSLYAVIAIERLSKDSLIVVELVTAIAVYLVLPSYQSQYDHYNFAEKALSNSSVVGASALYYWLLSSTSPNDIILADEDVSLYRIAAANRKVVALPSLYSSPYVNYQERRDDQIALFRELKSGYYNNFKELNQKYNVKYIIADQAATDSCCIVPELPRDMFRLLLIAGRFKVYEVPGSLR